MNFSIVGAPEYVWVVREIVVSWWDRWWVRNRVWGREGEGRAPKGSLEWRFDIVEPSPQTVSKLRETCERWGCDLTLKESDKVWEMVELWRRRREEEEYTGGRWLRMKKFAVVGAVEKVGHVAQLAIFVFVWRLTNTRVGRIGEGRASAGELEWTFEMDDPSQENVQYLRELADEYACRFYDH